MTKKLENALLMIWVVALMATLGSLYFSEIRGYEPCELCWYQRIIMYPIV
ncbi:MAG: disulfide bond formation protein B, partial [Kurthia sp.]